MGRQAEMLLSVKLKDGWQIDQYGLHYEWECSLPPRQNSWGSDRPWRLAGVRFGAPMDRPPDSYYGYTDQQVLCDALATFITLEEHECFEWFQVDGEAYIDPHAIGSGWGYGTRKNYWFDELMRTKGR